MAVLVRCSHCGAPHRSVSARERFVCDYCKGLNILHEETSLEELICPASTPSVRILDMVRQQFLARDLPSFPAELDPPRLLPVWQIVSREGEECLVAAALRELPMVEALRPPALPLVSKAEALLMGQERTALPLEIPREEAEATALASFDDGDALLEAVRLIWLPVVTLRVKTPAGTVRGLYLEGADRLLLEPVPSSAGDEAARPAWIIALAALFAMDLVLGRGLHAWPLKVAMLAAGSALAWVVFRLFLPRLGEREGG